jgi:hypothetical protein
VNTVSCTLDIPMITDRKPEGPSIMLLDQELARIRLHEIRLSAEEQRLARRLSAAARWRKVAGWAIRRAERVEARTAV